MRRRAVLLLGLLLTACAQAPLPPIVQPEPVDWQAPYLALRGQGGGRLYEFDAAASRVAIHVFRGGRAARLGHNHVLAAPRWQGWLWWPEQLDQARLELRLRLENLQLDEPALRAATGGAFGAPLAAEAIAATRANMLGPQGLDAERYPELRLRLLSAVGEMPRMAARIEIGLHGHRHALDVPLSLAEPGDGGLRIAGSFVLRQRDLGIKPFSVLGGLLAVQDELLIEFALQARLRSE